MRQEQNRGTGIMSGLSIRGKIVVVLAGLGVLLCAASVMFSLWRAHSETIARAREDAGMHIQRSVGMFMVSTKKFHDDFQRTKDNPEERGRIMGDWNRTIEAVDQAVIADHGDDKPRVRLIGDDKIFARPPLAKEGVSISLPFEEEAARRLMKGEKMVEAVDGDYFRMAIPLNSQAHPGCAECHLTIVDKEKANYSEDLVLGSLNAYIPLKGIRAEAMANTYRSLFFLIGSMVLFILVVVVFMGKSIIKPLSNMAITLGNSCGRINDVSNEVASINQSMAEGASAQASSLEETSASLEQMNSMTKGNADNAGQATNLMVKTQEVVGRMAKATEEMSQAISEIKNSSDQTAKIVKTIDEIAFQTNLLALNAAVEAARAGDAGKGFAVVAEEVRNLAQRSAEAAKNTTAMIEGSVKSANNGVQVTERVSEALRETVANSEKVAQLISEIAAASREQAQGIEQITAAVSQMDTITQQNAANSEEGASAAQELNAQAGEMNRQVQELVGMIGGGKVEIAEHAKASAPRRAFERPAPVKIQTRATALPAHQTAMKKHSARLEQQKIVEPSELIPLDDNDLKDF